MGACGQGHPPLPPSQGRGYGRATARPRVSLRRVAIGENCSISGKATGSVVPFATLGGGSFPIAPPCPSQVPTLPPALSPPSPVPSAPLVPYWVPPSPLLCPAVGPSATPRCAGASGHVQGAQPGFVAGPLWSCWDVQGHCRAPGAEGDGGHSVPPAPFFWLWHHPPELTQRLGQNVRGLHGLCSPRSLPKSLSLGHESFPNPPHASRDPIR